MKVWNTSSTNRSKCVISNKKTGQFIDFEAHGIRLSVPCTDDSYNELANKSAMIDALMKAQKLILTTQSPGLLKGDV